MFTKSDYLLGVQCPKLLWITKNDKSRIPEKTEIEKERIKEGYMVEELAQTLYPDNINLSKLKSEEQIEKTKEAVKQRKVIFQATFQTDKLYSRADILVPVEADKWDIVEVKSSTEVKDIHLYDLAFQRHVYEQCGLEIRKCIVLHINKEYIKLGIIEPKELLMETEVTEDLEEYSKGIEDRINNFIRMLEGKCPDFSVDDLLTIEYENICQDEFYDSLPENNIFDFVRILKKKAIELYKDGIITMDKVPNSFKLNDKQQIQKRLAINGGKHVDKAQIKGFLDNLQYPVYYLDFETISSAIPRFDNSRPYQQIPFQFSLHIQEEPNGEVKHVMFLADGTDDPRPKFLQALKDNLGDKGDIIVYNQRFEKMIFEEGAEFFPLFLDWHTNNILPRIKDLMAVFDKFHYYDPKQNGSVSIKYVLPLLTDLKYDDMEIGKGDLASHEYARVTYGDVSGEDKKKVREALEKYCELDTLAEVEIIKSLGEIIK